MVAGKKFPQVDKAKKAITIYSGRQKLLTTFSVPDEYLSLPDNTWEAGDEVRIYYKEPGKAAAVHEHHQDGHLQEVIVSAGISKRVALGAAHKTGAILLFFVVR